jgi:hypothetical protein
MNLEQLKQAVQDFFGDTTRTQKETAEGLREAAELARDLAETIESELEE